MRNKQRGYFQLNGIGTVLGIIAAVIFVAGIVVGAVAHPVWGWIKPLIHSLTA